MPMKYPVSGASIIVWTFRRARNPMLWAGGPNRFHQVPSAPFDLELISREQRPDGRYHLKYGKSLQRDDL
jgi:hypothetical protein